MDRPAATRRDFLRTGMASLGSLCFADSCGLLARAAARSVCPELGDPGELVGLVPLYSDRPRATPYGRMVGGPGLDARLFTDLSTLEPDRLVTPTARVFVRTAAPPGLEAARPGWSIALGRAEAHASPLRVADLFQRARPMGPHLIECAGNNDPNNFGLMSAAEWDGVLLSDIVGPLMHGPDANVGVLVGGMDDTTREAWRSTPGASWILPLASLDRLGAFLAVRMNGDVLTPDHGAPVRLVVPGWYGCAWIKWVNELRLVGADEPATSQMREFAARTHQDGVPALARDYQPPAIDLAAMPVRVEKRRISGRLVYRIIGIVWGGERTTSELSIRFGSRQTPIAFPVCPARRTHTTWSLWEYRWQPAEPGEYDIVLKATDPSIRTRRLDLSFYIRRVRVDEV
jgi:DMSO/TMAO reductase YedYZ molybdopterin-dependent catalytic subunit